jgi:hypothetical protein
MTRSRRDMKTGPYLVAGSPEDVARAMVDGKPLSPELASMRARALKETVAALAREHGIDDAPTRS